MIPNIDPALEFHVEHRHNDGSSHPMEAHHTPDDHDPERSWLRGQQFRCMDCNETVTLIPSEES